MSIVSDPYEYADHLAATADHLVSDMTSLTVQDLADILRDASKFIEQMADEHNSYTARTRVTLNVGHEVLDLTEEILPMIKTQLLQEWIRDAVISRLNGGAHHTHSH